MIEISHLTKKYGDHYAIKDLSFKIENGQIYGFLGPNGAGKSTTMNIITGYLAATSGDVVIDGHDILKEPELAKKSIGYLPEMPPLYPEMTVREYLQFVAELKKVPKKEQKKQIEEIMDMVGIGDMQKRLIRNLSKGYKQRVGMAQAILGYPETIILDEPTVGLDPKQMIEIRDMIRGLKEKHTVILSSHILSEVSAVCDHILILSKGQLVVSDTAENLEKRMQKSREIEILVKGEKEQLQKAMLELCDGNETMNWKEEGEFVTVSFELPEEGEDPREKLTDVLAQSHLPIYGMNTGSRSLEDIFLELTEQDETGQEELSEKNEEQGDESNDSNL